MAARTPGKRFSGWFKNPATNKLDIYYLGNRLGGMSTTVFDSAAAYDSTTTITAGTGLTVTAGNYTQTASDFAITAGNVRLGVVSAFATTQPTSCLVMKVGTAAAGAITTSSGVMTDGATIQKIIADGTVTDIET